MKILPLLQPISASNWLASLSLFLLAGLNPPANASLKAAETNNSKAASSIEDAKLPVEEVIVSARLPLSAIGQKTVRLPLNSVSVARLDDVLGSVPGVTLFRRANSLSANPTTQGLSMRGIGGNAAGRVLVSLDGIPLNDPFGGWINWASLPLETLNDVAVQSGGGAGAFGASSLAGSVALSSKRPLTDSGYGRFSFGSFETIEAAAGFSLGTKDGGIAIDGGYFETDGFDGLRAGDRGPIDVPFASDIARINVRGERQIGASRLFATLRYFDENRINGFENAPNSTEGIDASLRLTTDHGDDIRSEVLIYTRHRTLKNSFVAARDNRTTARLVLDQTDVPGEGYGFLARLQRGGIEIGVDGEWRSGETNELFRNLGAGFTRQRVAGGNQSQIGAYLQGEQRFDKLTLAGVLRFDAFEVSDGSRVESDLASGNALVDRSFESVSGVVPTGRLGATYDITPAISLRANAYRSWRLPTINEYFRPFRVGNDITEANAALRPELLWGVDTGISYQPLNSLTLDLTYFRSWLQNGVGNITIGFGPGFFTPGGFVPPGGVLRQRNPIDLAITDGVEASATLSLSNGFTFVGRYQWAAARIANYDAEPQLVRNRPIQVPTHRGFASLTYEADWATLSIEARYTGSQFDDDLNTRRLPSAFTVNTRILVPVPGTPVTIEASAENLFDEEVISALSAAGLTTLAQPQFFRVGVRLAF